MAHDRRRAESLPACCGGQDWRDSDNIVARLNLPNMRYDPSERVAVYAMALRGLMQLEPDPEKRLKHIEFVDTYTNLSDTERETYRHQYPEENRAMVSFQTRFEQQGEQQGKAEMLLFLLEQKFGAVGKEVRQRIEEADDPDTLLRWSGRVLSEDSIDDVLR